MREIIINKNDSGQRIDKFLIKYLNGIPISLLNKYFRKKCIKLNGIKAENSQMLHEGDVIRLYISDEFFAPKSSLNDIVEYDNIKVSLDIIFEDDNIIIVSKKPGVLAHSGDKGENDYNSISDNNTLIFYIKAYLYQKCEWNPKTEQSFVPALCNRIDRNTGGLVIAAKNANALRDMNLLIKEGKIDKRYLAAVHGKMIPNNATLSAFLFKNSKTKMVKVSNVKTQGSKEIVTTYKTISYNDKLDASLIEVKLETGRTHQIRAHMSYIGHPLLGEGKYSENREDRKLGYKYQALYSYKVKILNNDTSLSYLSEKTFMLNTDSIFFLRDFNLKGNNFGKN